MKSPCKQAVLYPVVPPVVAWQAHCGGQFRSALWPLSCVIIVIVMVTHWSFKSMATEYIILSKCNLNKVKCKQLL